MNLPSNQPALFLNKNEDSFYYTQFVRSMGKVISFRSLSLETDIDLIHQWVNMEYARRFWQLAVSRKKVLAVYSDILSNQHGHSIIGLLDDIPICLIDIYQVWADELSNHVEAEQEDCGIHLLMSPMKEPIHGLTKKVLYHFVSFYFSFPETQFLWGEPDHENQKAIHLLKTLGFEFVSEASLSYKVASVFRISKTNFFNQFLFL